MITILGELQMACLAPCKYSGCQGLRGCGWTAWRYLACYAHECSICCCLGATCLCGLLVTECVTCHPAPEAWKIF